MARQCHLDTCPTGIATQREDLRAKFTGTPEMVVAFFLRLAEDLRRSLAAVGARSVGEVVGEGRRYLREAPGGTIDLSALLSPAWSADAGRRAAPATASRGIARQAASSLESRLVTALDGQEGGLTASGLRVTTAERSFGAALTGAIRRGELRAPVKLTLAAPPARASGHGRARASRSCSRARPTTTSARGSRAATWSSARRRRWSPARPWPPPVRASFALAGNTCLYGATAGRLHVVGRAGMRFAIRNSGAEAVVEGLGPHGCEYMTGGTVVVLGPVGQSFGAGMTGGRAFLWDPSGRHVAALHAPSVQAVRLAEAVAVRDDGKTLAADLRRLLGAHRDAGSALAARLLDGGDAVLGDIWLVEPVPAAPAVVAAPAEAATAVPTASPAPSKAADAQPNRNRAVA